MRSTAWYSKNNSEIRFQAKCFKGLIRFDMDCVCSLKVRFAQAWLTILKIHRRSSMCWMENLPSYRAQYSAIKRKHQTAVESDWDCNRHTETSHAAAKGSVLPPFLLLTPELTGRTLSQLTFNTDHLLKKQFQENLLVIVLCFSASESLVLLKCVSWKKLY